MPIATASEGICSSMGGTLRCLPTRILRWFRPAKSNHQTVALSKALTAVIEAAFSLRSIAKMTNAEKVAAQDLVFALKPKSFAFWTR